MKASFAAYGNETEVEIPGSMHPVLAMLTFIPIMAVILITLALMVERAPPFSLFILLSAVIVSCVWLAASSLQVMLGGKVRFEDDGVRVSYLFSDTTYPWATLDGCKVTLATGTLGDDSLVEADDRAGVGLFIRNSQRRRVHDLDADVVLCAGVKGNLQPLMQLASKVDAAIKRQHGAPRGLPGVAARAPSPKFNWRPGKARPTNAPKADPVASFRNRAKGASAPSA